MTTHPGSCDIGDAVADVTAFLRGLEGDSSRLVSDRRRLERIEGLLVAMAQLHGVLMDEVASAVDEGSSEAAHGTSLRSWLSFRCRLSPTQAGALVADADRHARFEKLAVGCRAGRVSPAQARVIGRALDRLPDDLPTEVVQAGEALIVGQADEFDSRGLEWLGNRLVETIAPEMSDAHDQRLLEREARLAERSRYLTFLSDGHGSFLVRGQLPSVTAEPLLRVLEAYADRDRRRALDCADPLAVPITLAMRRADALLALAHDAAARQLAPSQGGDRPRLVVTIPYRQLMTDCTRAEILTSGDRLTPGQLRQVACDAEILPVVLSGAGEVLDVGRAHRLVTGPIRAALTVRDQGCAFAGCDRPPAACHAHHIIPWWAGGSTALNNLVLVCPHHHGIVEPGHDPTADRWRITIDRNGMPATIPPRYVDPKQRPRTHQRHRQTFFREVA